MDSHPIAFFVCLSNGLFEAQQMTCLISSTFPPPKRNGAGDLKSGLGFYIPKNNLRRSIALYCVRSLPKHTWINDNNRFIGKE